MVEKYLNEAIYYKNGFCIYKYWRKIVYNDRWIYAQNTRIS